jgi:hypothetical protein
MSGCKDEQSDVSPSIYVKFKENQQKIFKDESFKEGLDKGYQMLEERQASKNTNRNHGSKAQVGILPSFFCIQLYYQQSSVF